VGFLRRYVRVLVIFTLATLAASVVAVVAIEVWVRSRWDHTRGTPGFYLTDAWRGQRLAAGYRGWFAGVPVEINSLGFRDPREYTLEKAPGTFRILVIGDSVTFGHGATFETTYPYLLEQRLRRWKPEVRWEVWNLGVPGYNTRQELTYLKEVGPRFQPDLVIIGFYPNDFTANDATGEPSWVKIVAAPAAAIAQRHWYSFEFYKRIYLSARWRFSAEAVTQNLGHLQSEADLLTVRESLIEAPEQRLTAVDYLADDDVRSFRCIGAPPLKPGPGELAKGIREEAPDLQPWLSAVRELQQLARAGSYRIVVFINMAPETCGAQDRFYNGGSLVDETALLAFLGQGVPAVSSGSAFLHYRPSQMPLAAGHSLGNSNAVKADVLLTFLSERVLPGIMAAESH
jgi:lysophospholipase L1-like esterase